MRSMRVEPTQPLLTWLVVAAVISVPLAFSPVGFAPFGPVKWILVSTIGMAVVAALAVRRNVRIAPRWVIGWLAFLGWGAVASSFAVDPVHTWIGTPDRHLGLLAWVLFAAFFVAGFAVADRNGVRHVLQGAVVTLFGVGVYVLFELAGIAPIDLTSVTERVGGPFGSAAYLGAACTLLIPIVVGAAVDGLASTWWRRIAWVAASLGAVAALAAQTRAAWVGLLIAAAVALPAVWGWIASHRGVVAGAIVVVAALAVVSPIGSRLASAVDFESGGARGRMDEWRVGAAVLAQHPGVGLGFEGYRIGFAEGVDADYERRYGRVFAPDRAHNGTLDVALTAGIPALVLYLVGAGALLASSVRAVRQREPWLVGIAAGIAGYIVQQQFLFPLAEVDPLFWAFAGILAAVTSARTQRISVPPGIWLIPTTLAVAALVAGALDIGSDHAARAAADADRSGQTARALDDIDRAVDLRPDSIRYGFAAATIAARGGTAEGYRLARARIDAALAVSPRDPILLAASAGFQLDLAVEERDSAELAAATAAWEALVARDPHHAQYRLELGIAYAVAGRSEDAEREWEVASDLAPASTAPLVNLASLLLDDGRTDEAQSVVDEIRALDPADPVLPRLEARLGDG